MYYLKLDNKLNRTIDKEIYNFCDSLLICDAVSIIKLFLVNNKINCTENLEFFFLKKPEYAYDYAVYILKKRKENLEKKYLRVHIFQKTMQCTLLKVDLN